MAAAQGEMPNQPSVMVFFDWGRPELRRDDEATLDRVAAAYAMKGATRLLLEGHTDRSGSAATNRAAGLRRAEEVRHQLMKRAIPGNAMRIVSFGEDRPLVPTADGVREVQNRRVVIVFEE
ncbi:OmpA family protein [Sphingomonas xanthus]|nr:OmpA family protein [Sphingomonas xanthus]